MTPRASFVIPAYNAERWISKTLYSCRSQTIRPIEIIVVNDGSTDWTKTIVEWHASEDSRIRLFNTENRGRSAARNLGNEMAQSDIIMVLDSDDMATRNRAKDTIAAFQLKKPDVLFGSFFIVDSLGTTDKKILCSPFDPEMAKEKKLNYICHSTMAYRKRVTHRIKYSEGEWSTLGLDDWKFQWDCYNAGFSIKSIRNPLCYYRVRENDTVSSRDPEQVNKLKEDYLAKV